jgi:hypothetical protein
LRRKQSALGKVLKRVVKNFSIGITREGNLLFMKYFLCSHPLGIRFDHLPDLKVIRDEILKFPDSQCTFNKEKVIENDPFEKGLYFSFHCTRTAHIFSKLISFS